MNIEPDDLMQDAIKTYKDRGSQYGHTWEQVGKITQILYPDGVTLVTPEDFSKFHILQWKIGKLVRYVNSGSADSIHDDGVYSFILESIIRNNR